MIRGKNKMQDVCDVYVRYTGGDVRYMGCMNTTGIEKTISTTDIRCGIGAGLSSLLYTEPDMTLTITPAYFNEWLLEMNSGEEFDAAQSVNVWVAETDLTPTVATQDCTVTITGTPVGGIVKAQDAQGVLYPATFLTGTVTITGGANKGLMTVMYQKAVTGDVLTFKTDSYPEVVGLTLHTIAYDPATNVVVADKYFEFDKVLGDGNMSLAMTLSTLSINEFTARVLPTQGNVFGKYITVERT
jgi:hypothetical protein